MIVLKACQVLRKKRGLFLAKWISCWMVLAVRCKSCVHAVSGQPSIAIVPIKFHYKTPSRWAPVVIRTAVSLCEFMLSQGANAFVL